MLRRHAARHAHLRVCSWGRGCWAVRSACRSRVVLASAPAEADTRVSNRVALHLVDCHLCSVALHKLNKATALSGRDLDVGDFTKALEEGAELVLGHVARQTADENGRVVGIGELVHRLRCCAIVAHWGCCHSVHAHGSTRHTAHGARSHAGVLVLGRRCGDAHRAVAAVDTLHLCQGALLIGFVGEADEAVATRKAADGVRHDLGRLAGWEAVLENADENVFVDLRPKIADENGVFGATIVAAAIGEAAARSPVQLERAVRVGDQRAIQGKGLLSSIGAFEINEAISSITSGATTIRHCSFFLERYTDRSRCGDTYPENLSLIILTLTWYPMPNQTLLTKFSSIQGSSSPILYRSASFLGGVIQNRVLRTKE